MTMLASWTVQQQIVFALPFTLLGLAILVFVFMRNTLRTRNRIEKQLHADPDISEYLVIFDWSRKVLYIPTLLASVAAGVLTLILPGEGITPWIIGGAWIAVFCLNFLIDEYEISIKVGVLVLLVLLLGWLWLMMLGWLENFVDLFRQLRISMSAAGYFLFAALFGLAIVISWLRGLFYYVAITPNYLNIQVGPTETGEQFNHTEYNTRVDTGDFFERLMGFGRICITFNDNRRAPMILLVGRVGRRAQQLESIRGKLNIERSTGG